MRRRPREAERAGSWISLRRTVAVVARARSVPVRTPEALVRLNAITGQHQPGGVGGEYPRGQVRQRGGFQVGMDLFDDRVAAVGLIRRDGVE